MKLHWVSGIGCMLLTLPAAAHGGHAEAAGLFHLLTHVTATYGGTLFPIIFICVAGIVAYVKARAATKV